MDGFKEWISDNLRYIVMLIAVVLLLVIGISGVRIIRQLGGRQSAKQTEQVKETKAQDSAQQETQEAASEASTDVIVSQNLGALTRNEPKILTFMTAYYTARTNRDLETLRKLDPTIDLEKEEQTMADTNVVGYQNITTYSMAGADEGSVLVYVCYDSEVENISTLVPSLTRDYLKTDTEGNYYIADIEGDEVVMKFIESAAERSEVKELIQDVETANKEAKESDPVLQAFLDSFGNPASDVSGDDEEGSGGRTSSTVKKEIKETLMYANDYCNVRSEPNTESDATVIGGLSYAEEVTVTGENGDWYVIDFNDEEAYVSKDFLSTEAEFYGYSSDEESEEETEEADLEAYNEEEVAEY